MSQNIVFEGPVKNDQDLNSSSASMGIGSDNYYAEMIPDQAAGSPNRQIHIEQIEEVSNSSHTLEETVDVAQQIDRVDPKQRMSS